MKRPTSAVLALFAALMVPALAFAQSSPAPRAQTAPSAPPASAAPNTSPPPAPAPTSSTSPVPGGSPSPVSPAPSGAVVSPTPVAYKFISTPSPGPSADPAAPKIIEIDFNDSTLHAPGPVAVRVLTSANVATVTGKLLGHDIPIPQSSPGVFIFTFDLPGVPFFIYGKHPIDFVAATADGKSTQSSVTVRLAH